MMFFEQPFADPFGRRYYGQRVPTRYPAQHYRGFYDDDDDYDDDDSGDEYRARTAPVHRPQMQRPRQQAVPQQRYQREEDEEMKKEEVVDARYLQFKKKSTQRYPETPEIELESLSGNTGWKAQARVPRNLYNANIRLRLDGNDTLVVCVPQRGSVFQEPSLVPIAICYLPEDAHKEKITGSNQRGLLSIAIPRLNKPKKHTTKPIEVKQPQVQQVKPEQPQRKVVAPSQPLSPMTQRKLRLQEQEEDVFERALKYAIPD
jgi:hypothetical protein